MTAATHSPVSIPVYVITIRPCMLIASAQTRNSASACTQTPLGPLSPGPPPPHPHQHRHPHSRPRMHVHLLRVVKKVDNPGADHHWALKKEGWYHHPDTLLPSLRHYAPGWGCRGGSSGGSPHQTPLPCPSAASPVTTQSTSPHPPPCPGWAMQPVAVTDYCNHSLEYLLC
jgi:hypothetical protein